MIVVDASALVAFFLREGEWEKLSESMKLVVSVDHAIKEFYNAVWRAVKLKGVLSEDEALTVIRLFNSYLERNMVLVDELEYIDQAFKIALETGLTVYDSLYIALAKNERKKLLSLDERQRRGALELGVEVLP